MDGLIGKTIGGYQILEQIGCRRARNGCEGVRKGHSIGGGPRHAPAACAGSTSSHS